MYGRLLWPLSQKEIDFISDETQERLLELILKKVGEYTDESSKAFTLSLLEKDELENKWNKVLEYCRDNNNQNNSFYQCFMAALATVDLDQEHIHHANVLLERNQVDKALSFLKEIHTPEGLARMGDCYHQKYGRYPEYNNDYLTIVFETRDHIQGVPIQFTAKSPRYIPKEDGHKELFKQKVAMAIDGMLRDGTCLAYFAEETFISHHYYAIKTIKGATANAAFMAAFPCMLMAKLGWGLINAYFVGLIFYIPGVIFAASAGAIGALAGSVHGFFRSKTEYPLSRCDQRILIENLQEFSHADANQKAEIIATIIAEYEKTMTRAASHASKHLLSTLKNKKLSPEVKWHAVQFYMLYKKNNFIKNNGKRLFTIINNALTERYNKRKTSLIIA